jgi:hypothetical protein
MARNTDTVFTDLDIFAKNGDKTAPPFAMNTGWSSVYDASSPNPSFPSRETYNQLFYRLYALAELTTKFGGSLLWGETIAYEKGAIVVSPLGIPFYAVQTSTGVDPDTDVSMTYWKNIGSPVSDTSYRDSSGQVKVNSGNSVKPSVSLLTTSAGIPSTEQDFIYVSPLQISAAPTTHYPIAEANKDESSIFDFTNGTFLEYRSLGSQNLFRLTFNWSKSNIGKKFMLRVRLYNPLSSFTQTQEIYISEETDSGEFTFTFWTIADSATLPSPLGTGNGYKISASIIGDTGSDCAIILDNFVRFNFPNSYGL